MASTDTDRAAKVGNGRAAAMLAVMILNEELPGTKQQAIEHLNEADEAGFSSWDLLDAAGIDDPRNEES
jgi:hypothetical protein